MVSAGIAMIGQRRLETPGSAAQRGERVGREQTARQEHFHVLLVRDDRDEASPPGDQRLHAVFVLDDMKNFELYYQPLVCAETMTSPGAGALR